MRYRVRHETKYVYDGAVSVSHHILRVTPRHSFDVNQICKDSQIRITPDPHGLPMHEDYFGNTVLSFNLLEPHEGLIVDIQTEVKKTAPAPIDLSASAAWETVQSQLNLDAWQYVFDSQRSSARPELKAYALESFPPGQPVLAGVRDLTHRINRDFRFDNKATEISTPVETFFEKRRGVCQDFSHLQVACLRSLGLPARYVSGYLRTLPPPGKPRLVGADASHAWCAAWAPNIGWVDFDPTNDCVPSDGHITVAWGRDFGDVSPVYGVLLGGGGHTLKVSVDVMPLD